MCRRSLPLSMTAKTDIDTIVAFVLPDIDTSRFSEEPLGATTKGSGQFRRIRNRRERQERAVRDRTAGFLQGPRRDRRPARRGRAAQHRRSGLRENARRAFAREAQASASCRSRGPPRVARVASALDGAHALLLAAEIPGRRAIVLDERYHPVTGKALFGASELKPDNEDGRYFLTNFCIDPSAQRSLARMIADKTRVDPQNGGYITALTTDYVLSTGNNWKGPIGLSVSCSTSSSPEMSSRSAGTQHSRASVPRRSRARAKASRRKAISKFWCLQQAPR